MFLFIACCASPAIAQERGYTVKGAVHDRNGEPLPYVNVYLRGSTKGTTTNMDGRFSLRVPSRKKDTLVFQYIGFKKKERPVSPKNASLKIILEPQDIELPDVTIKSDKSDPGERIMDSVQAHRKERFEEVTGYSAKFYMKGKARLDSVPQRGLFKVSMDGAEVDSNMLGVIYLTESFSEFHYEPPKKVREKMISSKVSGSPTSFSSNRAEDLLMDPYRNTIPLIGISDRDFISPIGVSSDMYYGYDLAGIYKEKGRTIYEIEVVPTRDHDPVFHGRLHVVKGDWRIKDLDLVASRPSPLEFVDSFKVKQSYRKLGDTLWMPLSLEHQYFYDVLGFKAKYSLVGMFSEHEVGKDFPKGFFRGEVFSVEEDAREKDPSYWEHSRPVILDEKEKDHYEEADSLNEVRNSKAYRDSIDSLSNRPRVMDLLTGYTHSNTFQDRYWRLNGLATGIQFNTVEGWVGELRPSIRGETDSGKFWRLNGRFRYGAGINRPNVSVGGMVQTDRKTRERISLNAGRYVEQVNDTDPIGPLVNSLYSLLLERNYMKLYESTFIRGRYRREWVNGVFGSFTAEYQNRRMMKDHTSQVWFPREGVSYTANQFHPYLTEPSEILRFSVDLTIRFAQEYEMYPDTKRILGTRYPELYFNLTTGVPLARNFGGFERISLGVGDNLELGLLGGVRFDVKGGTFLRKGGGRLSIYDHKHFKGNRTIFLRTPSNNANPFWGGRRLSSFHTLPYYGYSTSGNYLTAQVHHRFKGFLINKVPLLRKTRFQMVGGGNYLYTSDHGEYLEAYVGIENMFQVLRFDVASSFLPDTEIEPEFRIGLQLDL